MNTQHQPLPEPHQPNALGDEDGAVRNEFRLAQLDQLICSEKAILYGNQDFKDDRVVRKFVEAHHALRSIVFGSMMIPYADPCICCIPAYGQRDFKPRMTDPNAVELYIEAAKQGGNKPDLLFLSPELYHHLQPRMGEISPGTHVIVSCDRMSSSNASDLRKQGIPAIDFEDYMRCAPLNAVIALTCFNELMVGAS